MNLLFASAGGTILGGILLTALTVAYHWHFFPDVFDDLPVYLLTLFPATGIGGALLGSATAVALAVRGEHPATARGIGAAGALLGAAPTLWMIGLTLREGRWLELPTTVLFYLPPLALSLLAGLILGRLR